MNGKLVLRDAAQIPVDNGSFRYGYGLFETMLVRGGEIRLKEYHWERLIAGLAILHLDLQRHMDAMYFEKEVMRAVSKNKASALCRVRLQVFAGGGGLFGNDSEKAGYVVECFSLQEDDLKMNENGLVVGLATNLRKSIDGLSNLKSCNALHYAMAARQAKENKWNDTLLMNCDGNVIESAIANIFWIKESVVFTPPLTDGCVAGVMRRHIIENIKVEEESVTPENLRGADEVFLTNAIKGVRWVGSIGATNYTHAHTDRIDGQLFGASRSINVINHL